MSRSPPRESQPPGHTGAAHPQAAADPFVCQSRRAAKAAACPEGLATRKAQGRWELGDGRQPTLPLADIGDADLAIGGAPHEEEGRADLHDEATRHPRYRRT